MPRKRSGAFTEPSQLRLQPLTKTGQTNCGRRGADMPLTLEDPPFSVDVAWTRNTATVAISGEVDVATAPELDDCLVEVVTNRPDWLVVDLAELHFIDCSGAAVLERARD